MSETLQTLVEDYFRLIAFAPQVVQKFEFSSILDPHCSQYQSPVMLFRARLRAA
jgi:hypothetical protein